MIFKLRTFNRTRLSFKSWSDSKKAWTFSPSCKIRARLTRNSACRLFFRTWSSSRRNLWWELVCNVQEHYILLTCVNRGFLLSRFLTLYLQNSAICIKFIVYQLYLLRQCNVQCVRITYYIKWAGKNISDHIVTNWIGGTILLFGYGSAGLSFTLFSQSY